MKKKCTTTNNAISICEEVKCSIIPATTGCVDPFTYVWNTAVNESRLNSSDIYETFAKILSNGIVLSNATIACCPSCSKTPVYALLNADGYVNLGEYLGYNINPDVLCCLNLSMNSNIFNEIPSNFKNYKCCDNDFETCLSQFSNIASMLALFDSGVVEINTYDNNTLLCTIYNLLNNTPEQEFQYMSITEIMVDILKNGFISYCCGCDVFIGSSSAFVDWIKNDGCATLNK